MIRTPKNKDKLNSTDRKVAVLVKVDITHLARGSPNANKIVHSVSLHI